MKHEIHVTVKDLKLMVDTIEKMPPAALVDSVMITYDSSSGIGYQLFVTKSIEIDGIRGDFKVEISDPEAW